MLPAPTEIAKESVKITGRNGGRRPGAGRPRGRKNGKTLEIEAAARGFAENALAALNFVAQKGKSEAARVMAANALLDRGYGRPRQALEHSGPGGGPIEIHADELRKELATRLAGIADRRVGGA